MILRAFFRLAVDFAAWGRWPRIFGCTHKANLAYTSVFHMSCKYVWPARTPVHDLEELIAEAKAMPQTVSSVLH